jgi:hypothetical protein
MSREEFEKQLMTVWLLEDIEFTREEMDLLWRLAIGGN